MKIINLTKSFNDGNKEKVAVNNVNLTLNKGLTFFVGKSGSGKSTLLNLIAGFELPSSGSIILDDIDITKLNNNELNKYIRFNIGYIAQDYHLIEDFTTKGNILLGNDNISQESDEFKNIVKELELDSLLEKKVIKLSGGEKQRVAIARVLLRNSKIILADEPTGNLDEENSKIIFNYLKKLSKDRIVIVVSHDNESAKTYGDRIISLKEGSVISDTNKKEIKEDKDNIVLEGNYKFSIIKLFKYAFSFLFSKKVLLFLSTLICGIAFGISSTLTSFALYDDDKTIMKLVEEDPANYFNITKNYIQKTNATYTNQHLPISKEELRELTNEFDFRDYEYDYSFNYYFGNNTGYSFIKYYFKNIKIFNNVDFLDKYNWSLGWGYIPTKDSEFLLTDYALFSMYTQVPDSLDDILGTSYKSLKTDEDLVDALNNIEEKTKLILFGNNYEAVIKKEETIKEIRKNPGILLVGSTFKFTHGSDTESILTGYIETKILDEYSDIIYTLSKNFDYSNTKMYELNSKLEFGSVLSIFSIEGFERRIYDKSCIANLSGYSQLRLSLDLFNMFGTEYQLNDDEIMMSDTEFRRIFQKNFTNNETFYYDVTFAEFYDQRITNNLVYSKKFKIKEVVALSGYQSQFANGLGVVILSNNEFNNYKNTIYDKNYYGMIINKNELNKFNIKNSLIKNNGFTLLNTALNSYYLSKHSFSNSLPIFMSISITLGVIGTILIFIYFIIVFSRRKRDLGILKTLGSTNKELNILSSFTGLLFFALSTLFIIIFSIMFFFLLNYLFLNTGSNSEALRVININTIFTLNPLFVFLFSILVLVLIAISIFIITYRIKKVRPMDSIKSV